MTNPIVIVGAGECGARVAQALRERGWEGAITLVGDEHDLPYERPPLSKQALTDAIEPAPTTICAAERFADLGIDVVVGTTVEAIDREAREIGLADGRRVGYEHLVLATGARARTLDAIDGGDAAITLRTRSDASRLRQVLTPGTRLVVIGGGFIGLEVASSARQRGCEVAVVEMAPQVMGRVVPGEVAAMMAARHVAEGVDLRCGVGVASITDEGDCTRVHLSDGTTIDGDVVVAGVGAVPNTDLAADAGLTIDNGIAVDEHLQTVRSGDLRRGGLLFVPAPVVRRSPDPARGLAQRPRPREPRGGADHRGTRALPGRAVVLVGPVRPRPPDRRTARRGEHHDRACARRWHRVAFRT